MIKYLPSHLALSKSDQFLFIRRVNLLYFDLGESNLKQCSRWNTDGKQQNLEREMEDDSLRSCKLGQFACHVLEGIKLRRCLNSRFDFAHRNITERVSKGRKKGKNLFFFFLPFLGQHLQHVKVPWLRVESELQLPAYTTATATRDLSRICDLHHSSQQRQIHNPLSEARDQTRIHMDTSWVCNPLNHKGNSKRGGIEKDTGTSSTI